MKFKSLISRSKSILKDRNDDFSFGDFKSGANWMSQLLSYVRDEKFINSNNAVPFNYYGVLKYGLSLLGAIVPFLLLDFSIIACFVSVVLFYLIEIHFLFLFPLLLDDVKEPFRTNILMIYKIGLVQCFLIVIPIASYMILGLLNFKNPLKYWYTECLSVLILYTDETTNR